jgi:hypothetical protein
LWRKRRQNLLSLTPVAENALILERTIERKNERIRNDDSFIVRDDENVKKSIRLGMRRGLPARRETGETSAGFLHPSTDGARFPVQSKLPNFAFAL